MIILWLVRGMLKMGFIYGIRKNDQIKYIGQTTKTIEERWKEHIQTALRDGRNNGFAIHAAIRKYGISNFSIVEIEEVPNNLLNEREKYWISIYNTFKNGYNLTLGGESCPESIKKKCYQYDLDGKFLKEFESVCAAARAINKNHSNIIKVLQGTLHSAYGFRWSYKKVKQLPKIKNNYTGAEKKIAQYDLNNNYIRSFSSTKEAARFLNKSQGNISSAANGKRKTAYGYIWKFI